MKKYTLLVVLALTAVSACGSLTTKNTKLADEAKDVCRKLGYEEGTTAFRDCTVAQFNRSNGQYIGVAPQ